MKKLMLALVAVSMAASAMGAELERVDLAALGKMALPAVAAEGIKAEKAVSAALQEAEVLFVKGKYSKLDEIAGALMEKDGMTPETLTTAGYISAFRRSGAEFKRIYGPTAPSRDALETVLYINGKMVRVMEALALKHPEISDFVWQLATPGVAMEDVIVKGKNLSGMRAGADKVAAAAGAAKSAASGPRYMVYTAAGEEVVTADQDSGLLWITNPLKAGMGGTYNWPDAVKTCEDLAYAGYRDWRLPTIAELRSTLPAYENPEQPLVSGYFQNTRLTGYWSADTYEPYPASAYSFSYYFKKEGTFNKTGYLYIRCVRGAGI